VTVATGFDVDYYLDQVGADYYLTAAGEPPGIWAGRGAEALGLRGQVGGDTASAKTMRALFHYGTGPDGIPLASRQRAPKYPARAVYAQVEEAIARRVAALGRFATPEERREIRLQERAKMRTSTPYYDMTFSAEKSVSLLYAGLLAAAQQARDQGDERESERLRAEAGHIEAAVMAGADRMLEVAGQHGAIVRTGHHSASSGEFRDAEGFVAVKFLQHTSRADDPQLHVQVTVLNKAQRADRTDSGDQKWRALDGRPLMRSGPRLGFAAYAGAAEAQALARLGLPLVKREDGNGFEIGGIGAETIAAYSSRSAQIEEQLAGLLVEYQQLYGRAPDRAALYKLRKRVTLETRTAKAKPKQGGAETGEDRARAAEQALAGWIRKARDASVQELASLRAAAGAYAREHPEARPERLPGPAERNRVIRAAIAEAQRQHPAWTRAHLEWELYRQMPVLPAAADWCAYLDAMADDALAGRIPDTGVIRIVPVPDLVDVSALDRRKDGTSVYRPPGQERFATAAHLDTEEWILEKASQGAVPQLVTAGRAAAALAGTDLDPQQRRAVTGLLTTGRFFSCLVAAAGTGKTHVMAAFSTAWAKLTGGRVICLTLSENAARVATGEGFTEAWNIARFFASKVPVRAADVLVVDEASQVSTQDLARICSLALQAGARVVGVGDTRQLPAVEAGGLFSLIARRHGHYRLTEVRRFEQAWERAASVRIGDGDVMALAEYAARGRIWDGPQDRVYDDAVDLYLSDVARGRQALLLAGSNEEAARLARLVRDRRIERGQIGGRREVTLNDGNPAGPGDLVRARLNTGIDAGAQRLANRDILRLAAFAGRGKDRFAIAERQTGPGRWSAPFAVSVSYLEQSAELAYAGNVYVSQGMTVDTARLVVSEGMTREMLYVGMTRGREENSAHVVTGPPDPADLTRAEREAFTRRAIKRAAELLRQGDRAAAMAVPRIAPEPDGMRDRAPWEAVLAAAMARDDPELTALEQVKAAQDFASDSRHLLTLAEAFWWKFTVPQIDQAVRERIGEREFARYLTDPERAALLQALRAREIGGRRIQDSLDAITGRTLDGARSVAAVLHGRLGKEPPPARGQTRTWAERAPRDAPDHALEAARMLDARQAELGRQLAARPPEWALNAWGVPPAGAGLLREDWQRRAGVVASYREAAGITDPAQAIGPVPSGQAQLREAFHASVAVLELPGDQALLRAMGRGQLEAQVTAYERAEALAPPDVSAELAAADRLRKSDTARAQAAREAGRNAEADTAGTLAEMTAGELAGLRVADAARREWAEAHATETAEARAAEAELRRRDQAEQVAQAAEDGQEPHVETGKELYARLPAAWQRPESQAQAEATPEPSWEPGEAVADMDFEAEI
jgi:conjugative relaxase-like TrwC/TraI family protein